MTNIYTSDAALAASTRQSTFITAVYSWMTLALCLTALAAMVVVNVTPIREAVFGSPGIFLGLLIVEIVLVIGISAGIGRLSPATAGVLFILYSVLNGVTISAIFLIYTHGSIATTFFVTAGTFAVMSVFGWVTRRDLTQLGSLCLMGLVGMILASIVNFFLASEMLYWLVTYVGIAVFVGLIAYDTQKLKNIGSQVAQGSSEAAKYSILGALSLYLDFVNLFLLLLRIFGRRR